MNRRHHRGFTLVEMMIALTLIGLAMTIAFAGLRFASRSWERSDQLVTDLEQVRTAFSVIRRQLVHAQPVRPDDSSRDVLFSGGSRSLEFVAPPPSQDGRMAGLYRYRLRFVESGDGRSLLLEYRPYRPGVDHGWRQADEPSVLIQTLADGRFSYFDENENSGRGEWQRQWAKSERLPRMVRLELKMPDGVPAWPAMVASLPVIGDGR